MPRKSTILTLSALALIGVGVSVYWWNGRADVPPDSEDSQLAHTLPPAGPLSPAVLAVLSKEPLTLNERLDALRLIRYDLPQPDRLALMESLHQEKLPALSDDDWFTLANDIMQCLRSQQPATAGLTASLLKLWHDQAAPATLRDYALQQLREWVHDSDTRSAHETDPARIQEIQQTFLAAIDLSDASYDPQSTILGTALLALHEWHQPDHPHPLSGTPFEERLISILADSAVHRGTRATALQIASQRKMTKALPVARHILNQAGSDMILRLAAINFLGSNGSSDDKEFLLIYQQPNINDTLLQSSLAKALQNLSTTE